MPRTSHVLQFRVQLRRISPPIWRRILVPEDFTFWHLHCAIQDAMGWDDKHLHLFQVRVPLGDEVLIGLPQIDDSLSDVHSADVPIADIFTLANRRAKYDYDFGDDREHSIELERIRPVEKGEALPACIGGRRACPPEDCGGPVAYTDLFLPVISDPGHPEHRNLTEWIGGAFDPEAFDPGSVVFGDPAARFRRAHGVDLEEIEP